MDVLNRISDVQSKVEGFVKKGKTIGFVPTMGYLHEGHLRLLQKAREENDIVLLSIFVNPLQFNEAEDLAGYPRNEERDAALAAEAGVDLLFMPTPETMYPETPSIRMEVTKRTDVLCGKSRPGHFDGVVTVLTKLFHIARPTKAYFGMKDAQQYAVVDALVHDFNFPIQLVPVPTVREKDGLAKSSRNVNLSEVERQEAPAIYQALLKGKEMILNGEVESAPVLNAVQEFLEKRTRGKIDYIELLSYPELEPVKAVNRQVILAAAVFYDQARLIDNIVFRPDRG
ncbi:pantoate--beta-alanine ligase [Halobacillus sp. ACCC02827]|uniref:pantoate--beta-alanine ligase n=1 Tax=Bacillaceae TaxID=186817 RepID=UPI0002A513A0|nr:MULTISPECIES: pantoate--beta-alanine ligase [Bacillaceae]ELK45310.1 pantoate--beta-alanine ligase [Halobacillus sp. BAB-2008]QHT46846.1 pantoate--beta-alanine ligase [Bacillus sp. SB49]WJE14068.1 pantoate--beta-alanine ligase [Halobacillus sp. ACCC02827]